MVKDGEIKAILQNQIAIARTYSGNVMQEDRAAALRMYDGRRLGNEQEGRSDIVSQDLTDMVHATIAQLQPGYAGDWLAEFEPMGPDDDEQAKAESAAVNAAFVEHNQGFYQLENAIMDALLQANGTCKVWLEQKDKQQAQRYQNLTPDERRVLTATGWELSEPDEDGFVTATRLQDTETLMIERCAPENILLDGNQDRLTYEKTSFFAERRLLTRSDLVAMGYNKKTVAELGAHTMDYEVDEQARYIQGNQDPDASSSRDRDIIEVYECYLRISDDGETGVSHLERIMYCEESNVLLDREQVDFIPYATGCPFLMPGRWYGQSLYHKLRDIVYGKTRVIRQWIDNNEKALQGRTFIYSDQVKHDDLTSSRTNGIVRCKAPPGEVVLPEPYNDISGSAQVLLEYFDKMRAERCGASMDVMDPEAQKLANVSGVSAQVQLNSREMMASKIARTLSETLIRNLYLLIHEVMRTQVTQPVPIKINGQWQEVDPAQWQPRDRLNIKVGVSPAERSKRTGAIQQQIELQLGLLAQGGTNVIGNLNTLHRMVLDLGKAQGLDSVDSYWMDPESPESQQAQAAMAEQSQASGQMQQQMMQMQMQLEQMKVQIDQQKAVWDHEDDLFDNETDRLKLAQEAEIKEAELVNDQINAQRTAAAGGAGEQGGGGNQANGQA